MLRMVIIGSKQVLSLMVNMNIPTLKKIVWKNAVFFHKIPEVSITFWNRSGVNKPTMSFINQQVSAANQMFSGLIKNFANLWA